MAISSVAPVSRRIPWHARDRVAAFNLRVGRQELRVDFPSPPIRRQAANRAVEVPVSRRFSPAQGAILFSEAIEGAGEIVFARHASELFAMTPIAHAPSRRHLNGSINTPPYPIDNKDIQLVVSRPSYSSLNSTA